MRTSDPPITRGKSIDHYLIEAIDYTLGLVAGNHQDIAWL